MPKIVDHEQRRLAIAKAANHVIAQYGIEGAKLAEIGRVAGVTTGAISHYFEDKEAVLEAALEYAFHITLERMQKRAAIAPHNLMDILMEVLPTDSKRRETLAAWLAFWGRSLVEQRLSNHQISVHHRWLDALQQQLRQHCEYHNLTQGDISTDIAEGLTAQINGLMLRALIAPDEWPKERQYTMLQRYLQQIHLLPAGASTGW